MVQIPKPKKAIIFAYFFKKMKTINKYTVSFTGLQNGVHSFTFRIDDSFFQNLEYSPIQHADIEVELDFDKRDRFFVLNFRYGGFVEVDCDRCTKPVKLPINNATTLLVKMVDEDIEDIADDEVMYIQPNENEVDFSQFLYENIIVDIPLYKTCEDDVSGNQECDEQVVSILENGSIKEEKETDPRWAKLKELQKLNKDGTSKE